MSHFTVAVITKTRPDYSDIEKVLAPYSENLVVPPYVSETPEQYIQRKRKEFDEYLQSATYKTYEADPEAYARDCKNNPQHLEYIRNFKGKTYKSTDEELLEKRKEMYPSYDSEREDYEEYLDKNGNLISTYNPKSKWDWWCIGGRWSGLLSLKNGDSSDEGQIKDINWGTDVDTDALKVKYEKDYNQLTTKGDFYKPEYYQKRYPTLEDYIKAQEGTTTYAVLDEDGNWHEKGEMYYFGISSATEQDELDWDRNYYNKFIKDRNPEYWITIVDCHI